MIVSQNALLNQYVPTFYIKNLRDGQTVVYDSVRKAFINADISSSSGVNRLGELLDVSPQVDNPLTLRNGQALIYNSNTQLWENTFIDVGTLTGVLPIAHGGTGATTATGAINALLPSQTSNAGKLLVTDGTNLSWTNAVTNISIVSSNGITSSITNPTTTPVITLSLGAITPSSIASTGTVTGSNLSGTNTGDQTITLTGDVTGSGRGTFAATLSSTGVSTGTYGGSLQVPQITVDSKGRITAIQNITISAPGTGTVTSVEATGSADIEVGGSPITSSGTLTFALSNTGVQSGTYGDSNNFPVVTIDDKGRVTSASTMLLDTTASDLLPADGSSTEIFTIASRHQYIVTGRLEIVGHVINNGRIAVL